MKLAFTANGVWFSRDNGKPIVFIGKTSFERLPREARLAIEVESMIENEERKDKKQ